MFELFTAQIIAAEAMRRHIDGARFDGPVIEKPSRWRSFVAALFTRSVPATEHPSTGLGRPAAA
jgi:hypothetical protein